MTITVLPIANGHYVSDSLPLSAQQCINWYPNVEKVTPVLSQESLIGTPGIRQLTTSGEHNQRNRGAWVMAGVPYFVNGDSLYRLESDLSTLTNIGTIGGDGRVSIADNGTQLCIVVPGASSLGYIYDGSSLTQITDADFTANGQPQSVVFIDGYFLFSTDSKKFIISALNDGLSYNALDFGSSEADPDDIVAPFVFNNQLFMLGSQTTEAFQNIGTADFPFQRTGLFIPKGLRGRFAITSANNSFMFLGSGKNESPAIWALDGNGVSKVSTTAIDSFLQGQDVSNCFAWSYAQKGAYFVGFSFPDTALVFDSVSGRWHERKSMLSGVNIGYRANAIAVAYGKTLVADSQDGRIGSLELDEYKEYGNDIIRTVATQPFQNNMQAMMIPSIELTIESGVGNADVSDPVITLEISKDGGKTWDYARARHIGKVGEYRKRAIWRRNGRMSRFFALRFTLSDAVKPVILQLTADIIGA